jgi:DNA polymerase-1
MADFSQIEVRIAAELAHDSQLIADLESSDVHRAVASSVYGLPVDDISTHQRRRAKALTFALLFDGTASTLYKHAKVSGGDMSFSEAIGMERTFFTTYQGLAKMRSKAQYMAQNQRVVIVRLPNGLRRVLFGQTKRASTILNTMIQGTAAVGLKKSIIEADKRGLVERYLGAPIHDELVSIVPDNEAIEYSKELSDAMVFGMHEVMNGTVRVEAKVNDFWEA